MDSNTTLWLDDKPISSQSVMDVLRRTGYTSILVKELVLDQTVSEVSLEPGQEKELLKEFREQQKLESDEAFQTFLGNKHLTTELLIQMLGRPCKVIRYRNERWGPRANSLYLKHKDRYDLVTYRRLQACNSDVMQEVFFRLKDREDSWETMARQFPGTKPDARIGPIPVSQVEQPILEALRRSSPGTVLRPICLKDQVLVIELERFEASNFDDELREHILRQEFENWLNEECIRILSKLRYAP